MKKASKSQVAKLKREIFARIKKLDAYKESSSTIRYAGPVVDSREINAMVDSLIDGQLTGWFGLGKRAAKFEQSICSFIGCRYSVFTNSGSSANLLAVSACYASGRIKRGDEFITPATTFPTTVNYPILYGLKPVFVDVVLPSYTANINSIEKAINERTKLIMLPHINGSPNDMKRIMEIAEKHGITVIEDTCDALGSKIHGRYVGTFGHVGTLSFYVAHHMATGEGGAVITNFEELAEEARSVRDWGRALQKQDTDTQKREIEYQNVSKQLPKDYEARYTYKNIGFNLKPIDAQAAMGIEQIKRLKSFKSARNRNYQIIYDALRQHDRYLTLPEGLPGSDPSWFVFPITIRESAPFSRQDIVAYLESRGIETRPVLAGNITLHPAYKDVAFSVEGNLAVSDLIVKNGFFVGVYPSISSTQARFIAKQISDFVKSRTS